MRTLTFRLTVAIFCPILFLYFISWDSVSPLPFPPTPPAFMAKLTTVDEILWKEWRFLCSRSFPEDSREQNRVLCQEVMSHCQKHYHMVNCPKDSQFQTVHLLEKCLIRNGNVTKFNASQLSDVLHATAEKSKIGLAVITYGCQANPYLRVVTEKYSKLGVIFATLCPVDRDIRNYPAAELVSFGGGRYAINLDDLSDHYVISSLIRMRAADQIQAALALLSKRRTTSTICLSILMGLSALTYITLFADISKGLKHWKKWALAVLLLLVAHSFTGASQQAIENLIPNRTRYRIIWLFPLNTMIRLVSEPFQYFTFYCYLLAIGKVLLVARNYMKGDRVIRQVAVWNQPRQPERHDDLGNDQEAAAVHDGINEIVAWLAVAYAQHLMEMQAARNAVEQSTRYLTEDAGDCPICMEPLAATELVTEFMCSQIALRIYHLRCIIRWIRDGNFTCPMCRQPLGGEGHGFQL